MLTNCPLGRCDMRHAIVAILLWCFAAAANAYHSGISETTTAASNASCNAAFNSSCVNADADAEPDHDHEEATHTASSSGFAAPAGAIGSSILEIGLLGLLVWVVFLRTQAQSRRLSGGTRS